MFFPCCVWAHHAPLVLSDWVPSTDGPLLVQQAVRSWVLVGLSVIPADLGQAASVIPVKRLFQSGEKKKNKNAALLEGNYSLPADGSDFGFIATKWLLTCH